ncbi:PREDICTED: F-box protein SKIP22-like [Camelina sativa]|uniref:F-box protein SKIP22-like n=1 Tax=Camelina sativa TaxID=90675 RepID=A0ABM0WXR7_CAMSA|nr:PREDICTED: F-box protein SKIP22-like [Camelina sativa]
MKLRLRLHETRETLKLELADTGTLNDLLRRINPTAPSSVHLSLNRKDELLASSPEDTLRSLGVTSGDLIHYSLDQSAFIASVEVAESSNLELGSESNQAATVHDSMGIGFAEVDDVVPDQAKPNPTSTVEDPAEGSKTGIESPEPMDVEELDDMEDMELAAAESKRLSEPFFLRNILLEKSGDTSELTTLASSVHAVMLESGFVLFDSGSDKFSFSEKLLTVSLKYTLPEIIKSKDTKTIESVTLKFQNLGSWVVVYGTVGGSSSGGVHMNLDKRRFVPVIDMVMDTLKSDKEGSSRIYREVFMFWRMVKDGLVIPLLIGLCDKAGLEPPPCLMRLPTDLKLKILELLPGVSIAKMCCLCTEMRYLASDNDLWKQKCLEEAKNVVGTGEGDLVNWKARFAGFWMHNQLAAAWRHKQFPRRDVSTGRRAMRFPRIIGDPSFTLFHGDRLYGSPGLGIHPGQPARGLGGRTWGQQFTPRCNLGGFN